MKPSWQHVNLLLRKHHLNLDNNLPTTLNRMMATASLTMPSPKMTEKSLGCCEGLIRVKAATESVALMVALNLIINTVDRTMT
jgi:hypothetical protein